MSSVPHLKAVGTSRLQSWLLLLKQKTTVVGPLIVSGPQRFSNAFDFCMLRHRRVFPGLSLLNQTLLYHNFSLRKLFMPWKSIVL